MAGSGSAHDEPDLVPLLDLVLQLVMFFMMCASFVMEQVDQTIMLPVAQSARPMGSAEDVSDVVFLNINSDGELLVVGKPKPLSTDDEVMLYLKDVYDLALKRSIAALKKESKLDDAAAQAAAKVEALVIVRAHKDANYASIYRVMRKCQDVGLRNLQLRAYIGGK